MKFKPSEQQQKDRTKRTPPIESAFLLENPSKHETHQHIKNPQDMFVFSYVFIGVKLDQTKHQQKSLQEVSSDLRRFYLTAVGYHCSEVMMPVHTGSRGVGHGSIHRCNAAGGASI